MDMIQHDIVNPPIFMLEIKKKLEVYLYSLADIASLYCLLEDCQ